MDIKEIRKLKRPRLWQRALSLGSEFRGRMVALCLIAAGAAVFPLLGVLFLAIAIQALVEERGLDEVLARSGFAVAFLLLGVVATLIRGRMAAALSQSVVASYQVRLFDKVMSLPIGFFGTVEPGALTSRVTNDVNGIEPLYTQIVPVAVSSGVAIAVIAAVLLAVDPILGSILLLIPCALWVVRRLEGKINATMAESFGVNQRVSTTAESILNSDGVALARISGAIDVERERFVEATENLASVSTRLAFWRVSVGAFYDVLFASLVGIVLVGGGYRAANGDLAVGAVLLFVLYTRQLQGPVTELVGLRYPILRAGIAFDRIDDVLSWVDPVAAEHAIPGPAAPGETNGQLATTPLLSFERVSFRYPTVEQVSIPGLSHSGRAVKIAADLDVTFMSGGSASLDAHTNGPTSSLAVEDISFEVAAGTTVALVGATGSGKSTIGMLAAGLLEPTTGEIRLGGSPRRLSAVGYISQSVPLLHASVRANLLYGAGEGAAELLDEACEAAQLQPLLRTLPEGLGSVVGERGQRLSGGERQRLALARAILRRSRCVVLDEPTAHLDPQTERLVSRAMTTALAGAAILLIAHRAATIDRADEVIVLEHGVVVDRGKPSELGLTSAKFRDLFDLR